MISNSPSLKPKDTKDANDSLAVFYFVLLGGASSCAWNAGLNCLDYFSAKFPQYSVGFIFPIAPYLAQLFTVLTITKLSSMFSYNARMLTALATITCITVFIPLEAALFKDTFFGVGLIMVLLFILGFNNNLIYASLAGLTSQIEGKYTAYFLIGTAINSLLMNFAREFTILAFNPDSEEDLTNVLAYFGFTVILLLISAKVHMSFMKSDFYLSRFPSPNTSQITTTDEENTLLEPLNKSPKATRDFKTLFSVFKEVKFYAFLLMLSYAQLLMAFPGLMLKKPIPGMANHTKTVTMLIMFNIFFILGKKMGQYRQYYNKHIITFFVLLRFVLVGLFVAQAVTVEYAVLNTVWFGYVNVALFGWTLGFVNVALFILAPEKIAADKKEIAGFVSVFGINIGLIMGAVFALPFRNIGIQS